tara:strand:+ start:151 stop:537 length:387 start_codon:yes stop_codon:yes gene_type:complete
MNISPLIHFSIISTGSLIGSNLRYILITRFCSIKLSKSRRLLLANLIASLILGVSFSLRNNSNFIIYRELIIVFLIGFSGSLSTFSSFINDLFKLSIQRKYKDISIMIFLSVFLGLLLISLGLLVVNF